MDKGNCCRQLAQEISEEAMTPKTRTDAVLEHIPTWFGWLLLIAFGLIAVWAVLAELFD
jgi:uncharacterized Tic20 family protein